MNKPHIPPPLFKDLTGKTVIVTGANTGIGLEAAKHFARMSPARLIVACRSEERGLKALQVIEQDTSYVAEVQLVDFSDFSSVTALAARLRDEPIDILVANAGMASPQYATTKDGFEQNLQVNHLSTALLSTLLLPNLSRAAREHRSRSRVVIVSSDVHFGVRFDDSVTSSQSILKTLSDPQYCTPTVMKQRYHQSKLLNVLFTRAFADHLPQAVPIIPTTVNPGFCFSELRRHLPPDEQEQQRRLDELIGRTPEEGARQLVWASIGPDGQEGDQTLQLRGAYVSTAAVEPPSEYVRSKEGRDVQERIWNETMDVLRSLCDFDRVVEKCTPYSKGF